MDNLTNYYDPRLDFGEFNHKYAHDGDEHDLLNGFCACGKPENADDSFIKMKDVFPLSDYEKEKILVNSNKWLRSFSYQKRIK